MANFTDSDRHDLLTLKISFQQNLNAKAKSQILQANNNLHLFDLLLLA